MSSLRKRYAFAVSLVLFVSGGVVCAWFVLSVPEPGSERWWRLRFERYADSNYRQVDDDLMRDNDAVSRLLMDGLAIPERDEIADADIEACIDLASNFIAMWVDAGRLDDYVAWRDAGAARRDIHSGDESLSSINESWADLGAGAPPPGLSFAEIFEEFRAVQIAANPSTEMVGIADRARVVVARVESAMPTIKLSDREGELLQGGASASMASWWHRPVELSVVQRQIDAKQLDTVSVALVIFVVRTRAGEWFPLHLSLVQSPDSGRWVLVYLTIVNYAGEEDAPFFYW